jgi:CRISPR/Cas system CMR-associated protein Cmr5 small subunit
MLNPKQVKCLELMIQGQLTDKDIAKAINITQKTICEWKKNNKEFQDEYNSLMRSSLQYAAPKAFRKQLSLLNSKNDMVAHLAAKDIMDRAGFNPVEKVDLNAEVDMELNINIDYGDEE